MYLISIILTFLLILYLIFGNRIKKLLLVVALLVAVIYLLKAFVFDIYYIPSPSMEATLRRGDVVLMKKFPSGVFKKSIANALFKNEGNSVKQNNFKPVNIERNDILIFLDPNRENRYLIKRCIGIPGDTLLIDSANVYINHELSEQAENVVQKFLIHSSVFKKDSAGLKGYLNNFYERNDTVFYTIQQRFIDRVAEIDKAFISNKYLVRRGRWIRSQSSLYSDNNWSIDYFGPVVIPKKGMQIVMDSSNFEKCGYIISEYENGKAVFKNEDFSALTESSYSFSKDYYFFMGDNRHNSIDSRYIGVIPADKIIGKVSRILFSVDNGEVEWGRTLRRVK